ncbi:MAG: hypothetical protein AAFP89_19375 [Bacteroidota bacterium]
MTPEQVSELMVQIWEGPVARTYLRGELCSKVNLQAEIYRHFQALNLPDLKIWFSVPLVFPPFLREEYLNWRLYRLKKALDGQVIDMVVSEGTDILMIGELNFDPGGYGDYRKDMKRLCGLAQLAGEGILYISRTPFTGQVDDGLPFLLHEELLTTYMVINQKASMGLELNTLKKAYTGIQFPSSFLHLKAAVQEDKVLFGHK